MWVDVFAMVIIVLLFAIEVLVDFSASRSLKIKLKSLHESTEALKLEDQKFKNVLKIYRQYSECLDQTETIEMGIYLSSNVDPDVNVCSVTLLPKNIVYKNILDFKDLYENCNNQDFYATVFYTIIWKTKNKNKFARVTYDCGHENCYDLISKEIFEREYSKINKNQCKI